MTALRVAIKSDVIIIANDQRPESMEPVKVEMNQNDSISGIEHNSDSRADIRVLD